MSAVPLKVRREPVDVVLAEWVQTMYAAGMSPNTVRTRVKCLETLSRRRVDLLEASTGDVVAWLSRDHLKPWSRTTYYAAAKTWFEWLQATGRRADNPMAGLRKPRVPRGAPRPLDVKVVRRLLASTSGRTRTYVLLAAYQGLRVHEIAKIRGQDVTEDTLRVVGKGGVEAVLPTHPIVWAEAQRYPSRGYWFPAAWDRRRHVQGKSIGSAITKALEQIGAKGTAHQLRHLYGTQVLRAAGGNIRVAQELLRHASPTTTALYTLVEDSERRSAVLALPDYTTSEAGQAT